MRASQRGRATRRLVFLSVLTAAAATAAACTGTGSASSSPTGSMAMESTMPMGSESESFAFGHPADASSAERTVEIEALDKLRFDPGEVSVKVGETLTFRVHNAGQTRHELVLGPTEVQDEHEEEMQAMASGMAMEDEPNAIDIEPGQTKELTWTFTQAGTLQFACHEPGHYAGGMIGTITVTGS